MQIKSTHLCTLALLLGMFQAGFAQEGSYILKRQLFKVPLTSVNISPDGKVLLAGFDDGSFRMLDPDSFLTLLEVKDAHDKAVNAMDMPPKMDFILTAGRNSIKLWDKDGNYLFAWKGHATTIWNAEISKDGKWAVSSAMNKTFLLWDVYNNKEINNIPPITNEITNSNVNVSSSPFLYSFIFVPLHSIF